MEQQKRMNRHQKREKNKLRRHERQEFRKLGEGERYKINLAGLVQDQLKDKIVEEGAPDKSMNEDVEIAAAGAVAKADADGAG